MSKFVLTNAYVALEGADISGYARAVGITVNSEEIDTTPLAAVPYRTSMDGERTIDVALDVLAGNDTIRDTLQTAYNAGTQVAIDVRPRNELQSPTNPTVSVSCVVMGWAQFSGPVGEAARPFVRLAATGAEVTDDTALLEALVLDGLLMVTP